MQLLFSGRKPAARPPGWQHSREPGEAGEETAGGGQSEPPPGRARPCWPRVPNRRQKEREEPQAANQSRQRELAPAPSSPAGPLASKGRREERRPRCPGTRQSRSERPRLACPLPPPQPIRMRGAGQAELFKSTPQKSCLSERHAEAGSKGGTARPRANGREGKGRGPPVGGSSPISSAGGGAHRAMLKRGVDKSRSDAAPPAKRGGARCRWWCVPGLRQNCAALPALSSSLPR